MMKDAVPTQINKERLKCAHRKVAAMVAVDSAFVPIFLRLEQEIAAMEARDDVIERARRVVADQKAIA